MAAAAIDKVKMLEVLDSGHVFLATINSPIPGDFNIIKAIYYTPIGQEAVDFTIYMPGTTETRGGYEAFGDTLVMPGGLDVWAGTIDFGLGLVNHNCPVPWSELNNELTNYGQEITDMTFNEVSKIGLMGIVNYETNIKTILKFECGDTEWTAISQEPYIDRARKSTAVADDDGCIIINNLDSVTQYACPVYVDGCGIYLSTKPGEKSYIATGKNFGFGIIDAEKGLDVNVEMRYRRGSPAQGYSLQSTNNLGDAVWGPQNTITSPDGTTWQLSVDNVGNVSAVLYSSPIPSSPPAL